MDQEKMAVKSAFDMPSTHDCSCKKKEGKEQEEAETDDVSWNSFTQDVTMHGIRYINLSNTSLITKLIWLLVILVMVGYALVASYGFFASLHRRETKTKLKNVEEQSLQFPSVIICNHNTISRAKLAAEKLDGLEQMFRDVYKYPTPQRNWSSPEYDRLNNMTSDEKRDMIFRLSPTVQETITSALFGPLHLNITEEFTPIITDIGPCVQFNAGGKWMSTYAGRWGGLTMSLTTRIDDYFMAPSSSSNGFTIALIKPGDSISMVSNGIIGGSPGTSVLLGMTQKKIIRQPPPADGNTSICLDTSVSPNTLTTVSQYSPGACVLECVTNFTVQHCGCRGMYDVAVPGTEICNPEQILHCIKTLPWDKFPSFYPSCVCRPTCEEVHYFTQAAVFTFPNRMYMLDLLDGFDVVDYMRANMVELKIFYKSLSYDLVEEELAYGWMDVIANLGGTLGVCIGASLLTICEFIQFGIWKASLFFKRFTNKRSTSRVQVLPAIK